MPFTSWTAFSVGLISDFGLGFDDYLRAVPFMFYPLAMILLSLLLALGALPRVGGLKQAYRRVASGGAPFEQSGSAEKLVDIADVDEDNVSSAWNAIIPLAALVGGTVLFDNDLLHSGMTGFAALNWPAIALAAVLLVCTNWVPVVKKWHPIVFIGISALVGVLLKF